MRRCCPWCGGPSETDGDGAKSRESHFLRNVPPYTKAKISLMGIQGVACHEWIGATFVWMACAFCQRAHAQMTSARDYFHLIHLCLQLCLSNHLMEWTTNIPRGQDVSYIRKVLAPWWNKSRTANLYLRLLSSQKLFFNAQKETNEN